MIETEPMILDIQGKQPLNVCAYMYVFTKLNVFVWLFEVFLENYPMNIPTMYGSYWVKVIVFNATFNNISVISWRSILLLQETGVPGENHRQTLSHKVVSSTPCHERVPIGQWYKKRWWKNRQQPPFWQLWPLICIHVLSLVLEKSKM